MILMTTTALIRQNDFVDSNVDDKSIDTAITLAQETMLQPKLGSALYHRLLEGIEADDLTTDEKILMKEKVKNAIIYYTIYQLAQIKFARIVNSGVVISDKTNANSVDISSLRELKSTLMGMYSFYENELTAYLLANSANFPLYDADNSADVEASKKESTDIVFNWEGR